MFLYLVAIFPGILFLLELSALRLQTLMMTTDGCMFSSQYDVCNRMFDGIFSRGLNSVLQQYIYWVQELADFRMNGDGLTWSPQVSDNRDGLYRFCSKLAGVVEFRRVPVFP
jgi:hypothetical protein